jgi:hypothetical protein
MNGRRLLLSAAMAVLTLVSGSVVAQVESLGERSLVFTGFYECKDGPLPDYWLEVTSLMLVNPANRPMQAVVVLLNGNEQMIAVTETEMSSEDLDEINICRTLFAAGINPPPAGMIEIIVDDPHGGQVGGVYGWIKDFVGKFFKTVDEPFQGRVSGIGKTECRLVPPNVTTAGEIQQKLIAQNPPVIPPILIEGTGGDPVVPPGECISNADCTLDEYCEKAVGDCAGQGVCKPVPQACIMLYDPVCGCDDNTYSNSCFAAANRQSVKALGACP